MLAFYVKNLTEKREDFWPENIHMNFNWPKVICFYFLSKKLQKVEFFQIFEKK